MPSTLRPRTRSFARRPSHAPAFYSHARIHQGFAGQLQHQRHQQAAQILAAAETIAAGVAADAAVPPNSSSSTQPRASRTSRTRKASGRLGANGLGTASHPPQATPNSIRRRSAPKHAHLQAARSLDRPWHPLTHAALALAPQLGTPQTGFAGVLWSLKHVVSSMPYCAMLGESPLRCGSPRACGLH